MTTNVEIEKLLFALLIQNILFIVVTIVWVRRSGRSFGQIGLLRASRVELFRATVLGVCLFGLAQLLGSAQGIVLRSVLSQSELMRLKQMTLAYGAEGEFYRIHSRFLRLIFAFIGVTLAPIAEECLFRGLLYNVIKGHLGVFAAVVLSSLIFALIHVSPFAILLLFVMGVALSIVYEQTGSLWAAIVMHSANNGLAFFWLWVRAG